MTKTSSPLHAKRVPKSVSKPTETAEAAATLSEAVVEPAKARVARKTKPAAKKPAAVAAKEKSTAKSAAAAPAVVEDAAAKPAKPAKGQKAKLVRDSFTIPKDEYQVLDALKTRALSLERHVRKSELLRAGIRALKAMDDRAFLKAVAAVPTLKTGRPKSD